MNKTNMNEDYNSLKNFWNEMFKTMEVGKIEGKWITDETFNNNAIKCLEKANKVLDYGCGSGWGLIELSHTKKFEEGLGIDTSETAVDFANKTCEVSGINNLKFIAGDQTILKDYKEYFDFILTVNTLDVLPDDITEDILQTLKDSLKANGKIMICLNPDFSEDDLVNLLKWRKKENIITRMVY